MNEHKVFEYERPRGVTRGQFRLLLFLVFLQLIVTLQATYAPGLSSFVKARWAEHRAAVARVAAVKQAASLERECLTMSRPATQVVWDEDPAKAEKLLNGKDYNAAKIPAPWQNRLISLLYPKGAWAVDPECVSKVLPNWRQDPHLPDDDEVLLLLHRLKRLNADERLVLVFLSVWTAEEPFESADPPLDTAWERKIEQTRDIEALVYVPGNGGALPQRSTARQAGAFRLRVALSGPDHQSLVTYTPPPPGRTFGQLQLSSSRNQLRLYAGQADANDPSHFTIPYSFNGVAGTIDGWLRDNDAVDLKPRAGKVERVDFEDRWDPRMDESAAHS